MNYQAIAFDLDGTLLTAKGTILPSSKIAIQNARNNGLKVFIVTGRHHTAVRPYYAELALDTPVICCNGTYLYDFQNDAVLYANPLSTTQAQSLIESARAENIHLALYTRDAMVYEQLNPHFAKLLQWVNSCPENVRPNVHQVENYQYFINNNTIIWKVLISDPDQIKMQKFVHNLPLDQFSAEWSWIDRVDITRSGNNKGNGLKELLLQQQINPESVIAFGDNFNDISMLEMVGMGVAMGESDDIVKKHAKLTIGSHNEDSIANALAQFLPL